MIFAPDFNPRQSTRGAAMFGADSRWPSNTVPYDLANITSWFIASRDFILFLVDRQRGSTLHCRSHEHLDGSIGSDHWYEWCQAFVHSVSTGTTDGQICPSRSLRNRVQCIGKNRCSRWNRFHSLALQVGFSTRHPRELNLKPIRCFQSGTIQHELLHVLGSSLP